MKKQPTSLAANKYLEENKKKISIQDKNITGMKLSGLNEDSYERIANKCNLTFSQVWKRLSELEKKGVI